MTTGVETVFGGAVGIQAQTVAQSKANLALTLPATGGTDVLSNFQSPRLQMTLERIMAQIDRDRKRHYPQRSRPSPISNHKAYLFSGSTGFEQLLAAEILATEHRQELLIIDMGELSTENSEATRTELDQIFDSCCKQVLFFENTDAIFAPTAGSTANSNFDWFVLDHFWQKIEASDCTIILSTSDWNQLSVFFRERFAYLLNFDA